MGMNRFIDEPVEVELSGEIPQPVSFRWRGQDYTVLEVLQTWSDWHFGEGSHRRSWRNRRHRNYFRVRTAQGQFELYLDRAATVSSDRWILYQELAGASEQPG